VGYLDSAAASHMTSSEGNFLSKSPYNGNDRIPVRNDTLLPVTHVGSLNIVTAHKPLILNRVLHVPALKHNLLSIKQLCQDNSCIVVFDASSFCVKDKISGKVLLYASSTGNVYPFVVLDSSS